MFLAAPLLVYDILPFIILRYLPFFTSLFHFSTVSQMVILRDGGAAAPFISRFSSVLMGYHLRHWPPEVLVSLS